MKRKLITSIVGIFSMLILILDSKTALSGAYEGIMLCIQTVIPALFPFFILSLLLTSSLAGTSLSWLRPLCRLLKIPEGSEIFLLNGFLGGYPVGAQSIAFACKEGQLKRTEASRMIPYCNNAGPAFIFGIGMLLFQKVWICFLVWGIQILSAFIVAILSSGQNSQRKIDTQSNPISVTAALKQAVESMLLVCGWVVAFRVILAILEKWCLWWIPGVGKVIVSGFMELSNGSLALCNIDPIGLRVSLFSAFLSFGGCCVSMQTFSVLRDAKIDCQLYLPSKITQSAVALLLSLAAQFLFPSEIRFLPPVSLPMICTAICILYPLMNKKLKIPVDFPLPLVYNKRKKLR